MSVFLPQIDVSEEDWQRLQEEAAALNMTVMELIYVRLGCKRIAQPQPRPKQEVIAPELENKNAVPTQSRRPAHRSSQAGE